MLGQGSVKPADTAEERAKNIFARYFYVMRFKKIYSEITRMDENNDGTLTEEEFLKGCLQDDELSKMLAPNVSG